MANDKIPKSGLGSEADRVSGMSPLEIRRGSADPTDVHSDSVRTNAGEFDYDKNTRESFGTDPWKAPGSGGATAPGSEKH